MNMLRVRQPFFVVPRRGGSKPGKRRNINRHRQAGTMLLDVDYFNDDATHSPKEFRRRFRMNKELFLKIVHGVKEYDKYFMAKQDCIGLPFCYYLRAPREDDTAWILQKNATRGFPWKH